MTKQTRVGISAASAILVVSLLWHVGCSTNGDANEIRVGVILPLTGPVAEPGNQALNGLTLAVNQYNEHVTTKKIRLIVEDSQSDPKSGVSAAQKLINVDHVKVIVGDLMSSIAMAVAPVAEQNRVVLFAPGASNPNFPDQGTYIFRNWASDDYDGKVMADYLKKEAGFQRGAVVYVNNEYGLGLAEAFKERYESLGGSILLFDAYDQGSTDFRPLVSKAKSLASAEFLYLPGQPRENGHLVKQLREGGVRLPLFANLSVDSPDFGTIVGDAAAGIVFTTPAFDPSESGSTTQNFRGQFTMAYGTAPDVVAGHGYDAGNILILALTNCNFDLSRLRESLASIRDFPGVTGKTTFTSNGDVHKDVFLKRLELAGRSVVLKRIGTE